jgi:hypothetical protein
MSTFKEITAADIRSSTTTLTQLVDVVGADISGSDSRKKYQVFVTGGIGPGVTSSLFQTVYDQDYTLSTANAILDLTVGLFSGSTTVAGASSGVDSAGKILFTSRSMMMREKINIYRQYAQLLLGDADSQFVSPYGSATTDDKIDEALIFSFKRLFSRDGIKRETYAMRMYTTAAIDSTTPSFPSYENLRIPSTSGSTNFIDIGSSTARETSLMGNVGNLVNASNTNSSVGLIFYDPGIVVLDMKRVMSASQHVSGTIDAMSSTGKTNIGNVAGNPRAKFIPDFVCSASIDNIVDFFSTCMFDSSAVTSTMTFQNTTFINSTIININADAQSFNLSSNPTFTDDNGQIIMSLVDENAKPFTFITSVGLYDANNNLLAVAKFSRPVEKNAEKGVNARLRIDF